MARHDAPHTVECYHCRHRFEVPQRAQSVSCPKCHQRLVVSDVVVATLHSVTKVQTCGRVIVRQTGQVIARLVQGQAGVEVLGSLEGKVVSGGLVTIGPKAKWRGDCDAPRLEVKLGARVLGRFAIPGGAA
jgi:DNA-directed RNA polymerase subunit RPC12/RpoP